MTRKTKSVLIFISILLVLMIFELLLKNHLNTTFSSNFNKERPNTLSLYLSMKDIEDINSINFQSKSQEERIISAEAILNGEELDVELSKINNIFDQYNQGNDLAFQLTLANSNLYKGHNKSYYVYKPNKINIKKQENFHSLAKSLGLYIQESSAVELIINGISYGDYIVSQVYNEEFLEDHDLVDSLVFEILPGRDDKLSINYIYRPLEYDFYDEHLDMFLSSINKRDRGLIDKFFDVDYISRIEVLQNKIKASNGFYINTNRRFILNGKNGKIYPVLESSDYINNKRTKYSELSFLRKQTNNNKNIKSLTKGYAKELSNDKAEGYIDKKDNGIVSVSRVDVKGNKTNYLDGIVMKFEDTVELYSGLDFTLDDNKIILNKGEYILREKLIIPLGTTLVIEEGTTIKIDEDVSIISYSPVEIKGTEKSPVKIEALDSKKPFGTVAVVGTGANKSSIEYLNLSGGSMAKGLGINFAGTMAFYYSDAEIKNSTFKNNNGYVALDFHKSKMTLMDSMLTDNRSHYLRAYGASGEVNRTAIEGNSNTGNFKGISLLKSEIDIKNSLFRDFSDTSLELGKNSRVNLYNNSFHRGNVALYITGKSQAILYENTFSGYDSVLKSYESQQANRINKLYILDNNFQGNNLTYNIGNNAIIYELYNETSYRNIYTENMNSIDRLFSEFSQIEEFNRHVENTIRSLTIGNQTAEIDHENKVIFLALDNGASTVQQITYEFNSDINEVYIRPIIVGLDNVEFIDSTEILIKNNEIYDFKDYIFYGKLSYRGGYQHESYDIYITTGQIPIAVIDTKNNQGQVQGIRHSSSTDSTIKIMSNYHGRYNNKALVASIRANGSAKRGYSFKLDKNYELEGMNRSKRWVLDGSFSDKSMIRSNLFYSIATKMSKEQGYEMILPQSKYIEVIIDGHYEGLYLLTENVDNKLLELEDYSKEENNNAVLYSSENKNANFHYENTILDAYPDYYKHFPQGLQPRRKDADPILGWRSGYTQLWPKEKEYGEEWSDLEEFVSFIALSPEQAFEEKIFNMIDKESFIDMWILLQLQGSLDGLLDKHYLFKQSGIESMWNIIPDNRSEGFGRNRTLRKSTHELWISNYLLERSMEIDSFRQSFVDRWNELLSSNLIGSEGIEGFIDEISSTIKDSHMRNSNKWPVANKVYTQQGDFSEEITYIKLWMNNRIEWLDLYINRVYNQGN